MKVVTIKAGLVAEWNAMSQPPYRVQPGDSIFQVNNAFGDTISIIEELKTKSQLTIHILRRCGSAGNLSPSPFGSGSATSEAVEETVEQPPEENYVPSYENERLAPLRSELDFNASDVDPVLREVLELGDEALTSLICASLEIRPQLRAAVLGPWDAPADRM